jgi:hypothetical protein
LFWKDLEHLGVAAMDSFLDSIKHSVVEGLKNLALEALHLNDQQQQEDNNADDPRPRPAAAPHSAAPSRSDMNPLLVEATTAGIQLGSKSRKLDMKAGIMDQEVVVQFRSRTMRGGDHLRLQTLGLRYLLASSHWVSYLLGGFAGNLLSLSFS